MRKLLSFLILSVLAVSMFSFGISGQELSNVGVTAGTTTEAPIVDLDEQPSSLLGGLITNIQTTTSRFVDWSGINVWVDETTTTEPVFDLYAFPTGTTPNFNYVNDGSLYQSSENVDVNGVTDIWDTYNADYTGNDNGQTMTGLTSQMDFDDGDWLTITKFDATDVQIDYDTNKGSDINLPLLDATGNDKCPTDSQLADVFGATSIENKRYAEISEVSGRVCQIAINSQPYAYIVDKNKDGLWDFTPLTDGFKTSAISGEVLMIADAGVYDIYGVLP